MSDPRGFRPGLESTAAVDRGVTRDGIGLFRRRWLAPDPRGVVLVVHGLNEHSGRYEHVARQLRAEGLHVVAYDQRGFGRSDGRRSHVDHFRRYVDDLTDLVAQACGLGLPTTVLGHSMGGLVVACHAVSDRPHPDHYVLTGPALALPGNPVLVALAPILARIAPHVRLDAPFDPADLAGDPRVGGAFAADPHTQSGYTVGLGYEMLAATRWVAQRRDRLTTPTLVLHGEQDAVIAVSASEPFGRLPSVERHTYPSLGHEVLNEPAGPELIDRIVDWIR